MCDYSLPSGYVPSPKPAPKVKTIWMGTIDATGRTYRLVLAVYPGEKPKYQFQYKSCPDGKVQWRQSMHNQIVTKIAADLYQKCHNFANLPDVEEEVWHDDWM